MTEKSTEKQSLIEFPTQFDLKVMGAQHDDFKNEILKTVQQFSPETTDEQVKLRPSSAGNFVGATVTVHAKSQEHLDDIYRAVTAHPMVKVVF